MKAIFSIMIFLIVIGISGCENDNSTIILENGTYEGTFTLGYADGQTFSNVNIWTADFDWGLILSGTYVITETNTYIEFLKNQNLGEGFYRYRLKKK